MYELTIYNKMYLLTKKLKNKMYLYIYKKIKNKQTKINKKEN